VRLSCRHHFLHLTLPYRLDFDLPGIASDHVLELLSAISNLPSIEALGFDIRSITDLDDLSLVASYLPPTLSALHLELCWENVPVIEPGMRALVNALAGMRDLQLVHIETIYGPQSQVAQDLAFALPLVEIIGLGASFWDMDRHDERVKVREWTSKQVVMRTAETVGASGEW
jgi:hypothetical protein